MAPIPALSAQASWERDSLIAARSGHALALDRDRGRIVLFGGLGDNSVELADTWEWDGVNWTQLFAGSTPSPRYGHAMAFDAVRGEIVLFGGDLAAETWTFTGAQWTRRAPTNSPPARSATAVAWDAARARIVLFGGYGFGALLADTWEWDGNDWSLRLPATAPPARSGHALTWDAVRERTVLFGGASQPDRTVPPLADTWEWDGSSWRQLQVGAPDRRRGHTLVAHDGVERVMLFGGGYGDGHVAPTGLWPETWTYFVRAPATWSRLGSGCPGGAGVPDLGSAGGRRPWLGDPFTLELSRLVPASPAAIGLGASKARWHGLSLPFDLSVIGMPGCTVFVALEAIAPVANVAGVATLTLPLCLCPELLGLEFFAQGVLLDPAANRLGLVVSNAGEGRIAAR